jgi:hypothetical protein
VLILWWSQEAEDKFRRGGAGLDTGVMLEFNPSAQRRALPPPHPRAPWYQPSGQGSSDAQSCFAASLSSLRYQKMVFIMIWIKSQPGALRNTWY